VDPLGFTPGFCNFMNWIAPDGFSYPGLFRTDGATAESAEPAEIQSKLELHS
jgi:hypothetical protein